MKKWLAVVLALITVCSLVSFDLGWITAETKEEVLREPPDLAISSGGEKVAALKGTYSWNYLFIDSKYRYDLLESRRILFHDFSCIYNSDIISCL